MSGLHQSVEPMAPQDVRLAGGRNFTIAIRYCRNQIHSQSALLPELDAGTGQGWAGPLKSEGCQVLPDWQLVLRSDGGGMPAHVRVGRVHIPPRNGEGNGQQQPFVIGGWQSRPELVKLRHRSAVNMLGSVWNVEFAGGHALAPKRASKAVSEVWATAHIPTAMLVAFLAPAANYQGPWAPDPACRRGSCCQQMRQFSASQACSWGNATADRPSGGRRPSLGRSRCNNLHASAYSVRQGTGCRGRSETSTGACGWRRRAG